MIEHTFDRVPGMSSALSPTTDLLLDNLESALAGLEAVDVGRLSAGCLAGVVVRMQRLADRLTGCHARFLGEADRAAVWASSGARGVAGWLAEQTGSSYGQAVEKVKLADAMALSPLLAEKVQAGTISAAAAVALHPAITNPPAAAGAADVDLLIDMCAGVGPRDAKGALEHWTAMHHTDTPETMEARRFDRRSVRFSHPVDGVITTTAVLPTIHADQLRKLLGTLGGQPSVDDPRTSEQCYADGLLTLIDRGVRTDTTSGRRTATLLVTIPATTLTDENDQTPAVTEFGHHVPAHEVRRLAENAVLHRVITAGNLVLDIGRGQRLATDTHYLALVARDHHCRFPGCHTPAAWCDIDHITPWTHGGTTNLDNLWLLCPHHHRLKHQPGVTITGHANDLTIIMPNGHTIHCPPPHPGSEAPPHRTTTAAA